MSTGGIQPWTSRELPLDAGTHRRREDESRLAWQQEMERALMQAWFAHGPVEVRQDTAPAKKEQPAPRTETGAGVAALRIPAARPSLPLHAFGPWADTQRALDAGTQPSGQAGHDAMAPQATGLPASDVKPRGGPSASTFPSAVRATSAAPEWTAASPGGDASPSASNRDVASIEEDLAGRLSAAGATLVGFGRTPAALPAPDPIVTSGAPANVDPPAASESHTGFPRAAIGAMPPVRLGHAQDSIPPALPGPGPSASGVIPVGPATHGRPKARGPGHADGPGPVARGEPRQAQPQPAVRVHAEWRSGGVRIWIGADAPALQQIGAVVEHLREWMRAHDLRVIEIVCNGRPVKFRSTAGTEYNQEKWQWPSTP